MRLSFNYLIFLVLLNQIISQDEITGCATDDLNSSQPCEERIPSNQFYKCIKQGKSCIPVQKDKRRKNEDLSESDDFCNKKTKTDCKLIFEDKIFYECEWKDETCKLIQEYDSCNLAKSLSQATNDQCLQMEHSIGTFCLKGQKGCLEVVNCHELEGSSVEENTCKIIEVPEHQECVKGANGCEIKTKSCIGQTNEIICDDLETSSNNNICYYDGKKCTEANSCNNVAETTINDNEKLKNICAKFKEDNKACVPDGKKCKLLTENETKDYEKTITDTKQSDKEIKDDENDNNEESKGENESSNKNESKENNENTSSDNKEKNTEEKNSDEKKIDTTQQAENKDEDSDLETSGSRYLSFSFKILFFVLIL